MDDPDNDFFHQAVECASLLGMFREVVECGTSAQADYVAGTFHECRERFHLQTPEAFIVPSNGSSQPFVEIKLWKELDPIVASTAHGVAVKALWTIEHCWILNGKPLGHLEVTKVFRKIGKIDHIEFDRLLAMMNREWLLVDAAFEINEAEPLSQDTQWTEWRSIKDWRNDLATKSTNGKSIPMPEKTWQRNIRDKVPHEREGNRIRFVKDEYEAAKSRHIQPLPAI